MLILPRYLLRLFLPSFLVALVVLVSVLLMNNFLRLFSLAVLKGISLFWIAGCFMRLLPFILSMAVPMAFLVALLLTLGSLSESGEVMALRASGYTFFGMFWPFLALSAALCAFLLYLNHKASPEGLHAFRNQYAAASEQIQKIDLEPKSFIDLGNWKLFADKADKASGRLSGIYLTQTDPKRGSIEIHAPAGTMRLEKGRSITLTLDAGGFEMPGDDPRKFTNGRFKTYVVEIPLAQQEAGRSIDTQEINSRHLREMIADKQTSAEHQAEYRTEIALRSATAFSPLVFFLIALPLGLQLGRYSKGKGFVISLAILFVFYGLISLGIGLGRKRADWSNVAPWFGDIAVAVGAIYLNRRLVSQ